MIFARPGAVLMLLLGGTLIAHAEFKSADWAWRMPVTATLSKTGTVALVLPSDVFAGAKSDLSDLRLSDGEGGAPFAFIVPKSKAEKVPVKKTQISLAENIG